MLYKNGAVLFRHEQHVEGGAEVARENRTNDVVDHDRCARRAVSDPHTPAAAISSRLSLSTTSRRI